MCGIVGCISRSAVDMDTLLLEGLQRLEYRGYDSAGIAAVSDGAVRHVKRVGRLSALKSALQDERVRGLLGIGHTRWATHGEPSQLNSHPHFNTDQTIAVVHNGIIENFQELKDELTAAGHVFLSETDTEVLPHLFEHIIAGGEGDRLEAVRKALNRVRGAYALGILFADDPETLYCARKGSPLIIGCGKSARYIASDVPAILPHIDGVMYMDDGELARIASDRVDLINLQGETVQRETLPVSLHTEDAEMAGFETFMLKEIHEQPRILRALFRKHTAESSAIVLPDITLSADYFRKLNRMMIVSCGTAYHAAMYGKLLIENLTNVAVETDLASEFRYRDPRIDPGTLVIAVSQSGETADTLASVRMAKEWGCKVLAVCNVEGSTLARESDAVFYTECGPEIGVASTKAYTAQLMAFALLALFMGRARGSLNEQQIADYLADLKRVPDAVHYVIESRDPIQAIAEKHHDGPSSLYLGRKYNYPSALEGALKNKEISYQHAEGYAAGEMKHGPIALINEYLPVVCICTRTSDEVYEKMISNMREVEARHGRIIALATQGDKTVSQWAEDVIFVPPARDEYSPIVNAAALQLLAYYSARARGTDIDKPRNLAKSVTVE